MARWLREADYYRKREEERAEARRTPLTRPALICARCKQELPVIPGTFAPKTDRCFIVEEGGEFLRRHHGCGGLVEWKEVTFAKGRR